MEKIKCDQCEIELEEDDKGHHGFLRILCTDCYTCCEDCGKDLEENGRSYGDNFCAKCD